MPRSSNAANVISSKHAAYPDLQNAQASQARILALKSTVEQKGPAGRDAREVDDLNQEMANLANLMKPLVPVLFPTTTAVGTGAIPPWVKVGANATKLKHKVKRGVRAMVVAIHPATGTLPATIEWKETKERDYESDPWLPPVEGKASATFFLAMWAEYVGPLRNYYMGPNPRKDGPIGKAVQARMAAEGKLVNGKVRYGRDATGTPLPKGNFTWHDVKDCEMGHVIDAVTWWNSNGRFTGVQSAQVKAFMDSDINYELEPSVVNQLRGRAIGRTQRYDDPTV